MYRGYTLSTFRRAAHVGDRNVSADVVADTKNFGRAAYLGSVRINLSRGKAFDANLRQISRYGAGNYDGPVGGANPAGGTGGRQAATGTRSVVSVPRGMGKRINFAPQIINAPTPSF